MKQLLNLFHLSRERLQVFISTSLLSVLLLVTFANQSLLRESAEQVSVTFIESSSQNDTSATLASSTSSALTLVNGKTNQRDMASLPTGTSSREDEMVQQLSTLSHTRKQVELGQKPSSLDRLMWEELEGRRYAVQLKNGRLKSLKFIAAADDDSLLEVPPLDSKGGGMPAEVEVGHGQIASRQNHHDESFADSAKKIIDRVSFLRSMQEMVGFEFKSIESMSQYPDPAGQGTVEVYKLSLNQGDKQEHQSQSKQHEYIRAEMLLDSQQKLLSLKFLD